MVQVASIDSHALLFGARLTDLRGLARKAPPGHVRIALDQYVLVAAPWVFNGRRWLRRSWEIAMISLSLP